MQVSILIVTVAVDPGAVVAVAGAESLLSPCVLSALSPVRASVPSPCVAARSCCVADDRCSCGSGGCSGSSKPACRCYRSVPCWAWCARSVCAASTALGRSGFCCKARIETHRTRRCQPTDLAAEPDTGGYFLVCSRTERRRVFVFGSRDEEQNGHTRARPRSPIRSRALNSLAACVRRYIVIYFYFFFFFFFYRFYSSLSLVNTTIYHHVCV